MHVSNEWDPTPQYLLINGEYVKTSKREDFILPMQIGTNSMYQSMYEIPADLAISTKECHVCNDLSFISEDMCHLCCKRWTIYQKLYNDEHDKKQPKQREFSIMSSTEQELMGIIRAYEDDDDASMKIKEEDISIDSNTIKKYEESFRCTSPITTIPTTKNDTSSQDTPISVLEDEFLEQILLASPAEGPDHYDISPPYTPTSSVYSPISLSVYNKMALATTP